METFIRRSKGTTEMYKGIFLSFNIDNDSQQWKCTKEFSLVLKLIMIVNLTGAAQLRGWKRMVNQNSNFQIIQNEKKKTKRYASIGSSGIESLTSYHALHLRA